MRAVGFAVFAFAMWLTGIAFADVRLSKVGPGGTSTIHVVCDDAHRNTSPDELRDLERRFDSQIILRCVATAESGSGSVSYRDFQWRYKYGNGTLYDFRQSDTYGEFGSVYGDGERVLFFGLPDTARPEVVVVILDETRGDVVFTTSP